MRHIDMKRKTKRKKKKKLESSQPEKCVGHRHWTYLVIHLQNGKYLGTF